MKLFLALFVAIFGICFANPQLTNDLAEFSALIPTEEVNVITDRYLQDPDFVNVVIYVVYGDFKVELLKIEQAREFLELINYLEASGLEVYAYLDLLHETLGLPPIIRPLTLEKNAERSRNIVDQCRDEVRAVLPQDEINALHQKKLNESEAFRYFAERLESEEIGVLVQNLYDSPIIWDSYNTCMENGLDLVDNFVFYLELFGFREINVIQNLKIKY